jgi:hypothetical protein
MKDNLTMLGANNDKPTPEEWLAKHERLHSEHLQRQQQVDLAVDYVTNEEIRGNEMTDTNDTNNERLGALIRHHLTLAKQREHWGLTDSNFIYHNASDTDVQRTWRKFGWTPQGEQR